MRIVILTIIVAGTILSLSGLARAQSSEGMKEMEGMEGMESMHSSDKEQHVTTGTVAAVDASGMRITIAHGQVPTLKWPAMKMQFRVVDAKLLDDVNVGDKIRFEFLQDDAGNYVVQDIRKL